MTYNPAHLYFICDDILWMTQSYLPFCTNEGVKLLLHIRRYTLASLSKVIRDKRYEEADTHSLSFTLSFLGSFSGIT